MTPEQADAEFDAAPSVPLTSEQIERTMAYVMQHEAIGEVQAVRDGRYGPLPLAAVAKLNEIAIRMAKPQTQKPEPTYAIEVLKAAYWNLWQNESREPDTTRTPKMFALRYALDLLGVTP